MTVTKADFEKVWASTSPLTPYSFSESQYKEGWNFIGSTPPSRQMWDFLQKNNDEKMQYLANNYLPLNGGTMTGDVFGVTPPNGDNSKKLATTAFVTAKAGNYLPLSGGTMTGNTLITMGNGESYVRNWANGLYLGGTYEDNASRLILFTNSNANGFALDAGNGTTFKRLDGNPDGSLTWDGQPLLPIGVVQAFAGRTIPAGWLLCDGSAVSRTTYAKLFSVIGTTYGAGNGSTTFNLPNLVDKFVEGSATAGTVKSAGLPNITGTFYSMSSVVDGAFSVIDGKGTYAGENNPYYRKSFDASRSSSIYGNSTTVQPPALTMRYIIKY